MTVADLIAKLQTLDPAAVVLTYRLNFALVPATICKVASTEYCTHPIGAPKVAIVPEEK